MKGPLMSMTVCSVYPGMQDMAAMLLGFPQSTEL